jgi:urate oxidase / 2-oxo-4-hydroxy-4-carboxy-5-ureidoimidazoline decarboxylase
MSSALISYGKLEVPLQRIRGTELMGCTVSMEVLGQGFMPAYTSGDNSRVVATDSMKNIILGQGSACSGDSLDDLLEHVGRHFLSVYPEMEGLRMWAREQPFVPVGRQLYSETGGDHAVAELELARQDDDVVVVGRRSGQVGLRLLKTTGSAFTRFVRDESTTLPERGDRPLYIHLDVHWRCESVRDRIEPAAVKRTILAVFDDFVSESIQHLVHRMAEVLLDEFPAMAEVSFRSENHTYDPIVAQDPESEVKGYTSAFPAWGLITLTFTR